MLSPGKQGSPGLLVSPTQSPPLSPLYSFPSPFPAFVSWPPQPFSLPLSLSPSLSLSLSAMASLPPTPSASLYATIRQ